MHQDVAEAAMAKVGLRDILSLGDRAAVMGLRRGPGQDQYLNSMEEIFAEADQEECAMPRPWAVHDAENGALVGFAMISDNVPQPIDDDLIGPYYLWKLLIDHRFQRRGYGTATLDAVVGYVRTRPGADVLYTSCADGPGSPRGFYLCYGFADTGRVMWGENVLALDLAARGSRAHRLLPAPRALGRHVTGQVFASGQQVTGSSPSKASVSARLAGLDAEVDNRSAITPRSGFAHARVAQSGSGRACPGNSSGPPWV